MNKRIDTLFADIKKSKSSEKYIDKINKMLTELKEELDDIKYTNSLKESLNDYFDEVCCPFPVKSSDDDDKLFNEHYTVPQSIKNIIDNTTVDCEYEDDNDGGNDNYIEATVYMDNITIETYVDYRRGGVQTGGVSYFTIQSGNVKKSYGYEDENYKLFTENISKELIDKEFHKIMKTKKKNERTMFDQMYEHNSSYTKEEFTGLLKLALLIPRVWYGHIF